MKISLKSILRPSEVLPFNHFFGNFPKESSCLLIRVLEGQSPACDWNWEHLSVQQHRLHKPQLCCQSLSVLTLKPRAGSVSWKQHYSIWKAPLHYLLHINTDSKQRSTDTQVYFSRTLGSCRFPRLNLICN